MKSNNLNIGIKVIVLLCCLSLSSLSSFSLTPKWVGNTPHALNDTYMFVEVVSYGSSIGVARMNALHELALNKQLEEAATVSVESGMLAHSESYVDNKGNEKDVTKETFDVKVEIKNQKYQVQAKKVDEYSTKGHNGEVKLYTLYMVALSDKPIYDTTYLTDRYGATPAFMSLIPGMGQWYKGSKVKGSVMLAGAVASVAGIIVCEDQRATYIKKMKEQPKFAKEYNSRASNYETGRNICIGAAAAVWVWSIVDAAVAKGARKVVVEGRKGSYITAVPMVTFESAGLTLAMTF